MIYGFGLLTVGFIEVVGIGLLLLAALLPLGLFIAWWLDLIHIARRTLRRRASSLVLFAVVLPVLWLGVGALIMVGIPFALVLVAVMFFSVF